MDEVAPSGAVQTDLPSPKRNRRKRLALRFAVLVAAVSVLGAAYWFTRPPELVWWRSPTIGKTGLHLRALIPSGWETDAEDNISDNSAQFTFRPVDKRPFLVSRLLGSREERAWMTVDLDPPGWKVSEKEG